MSFVVNPLLSVFSLSSRTWSSTWLATPRPPLVAQAARTRLRGRRCRMPGHAALGDLLLRRLHLLEVVLRAMRPYLHEAATHEGLLPSAPEAAAREQLPEDPLRDVVPARRAEAAAWAHRDTTVLAERARLR